MLVNLKTLHKGFSMTEQEFLELMEVCSIVEYRGVERGAYQAGVHDTLRVLYAKLYDTDAQVLHYPSFWLRVADAQK